MSDHLKGIAPFLATADAGSFTKAAVARKGVRPFKCSDENMIRAFYS